MKEQKTIIGLDWLQFSGDFKKEKQYILEAVKKGDKITCDFGNYTLIYNKLDKQTRDFKTLINIIYIDNETGETMDFALICCDWVLKKETGKDLINVKVYNLVLYAMSLVQIEDIFYNFFAIKNYSRIDFFIDFQHFNACECEGFIKKVANQELAPANRKTNVQINIESGQYTGLTLGTRQSACRCYLYNKTKELKKSNKEYIKELHKRAFGEKKDVWRLEFSLLKPSKFQIVNLKNEDYFIDFQEYTLFDIWIDLQELVLNCVKKFWSFKTNQKRRENCERIESQCFFENTYNFAITIKNKKLTPRQQKTAKTTLKMLLDLNDELREKRCQQLDTDAIYYFVDKYQLNNYLQKLKDNRFVKKKSWTNFIFYNDICK